MTHISQRSAHSAPQSFVNQASEQSPGLVRDLVDLVRHNKKWWLIPVVVVLMVVGLIVVLGGTAVAPFIYTLF